MSRDVRMHQELATEAIRKAEKATWEHFVELVKQNVGPDLAQHLDTDCTAWHENDLLKGKRDWRLNASIACVLLRIPDATEIVLQYHRGRTVSSRTVEDYLDFKWQPMPWNDHARFGAVRYKIEDYPPDNPQLVVGDSREWHVTDNAENAIIAAKEFKKEKDRLAEEMKRLIEQSRERLKEIAAKR